MRNTHTALALAILFASASLAATHAYADENGNTSYAPGASQFYAGGLPPYPGFYLLAQTSFYDADRSNDGNGDRQPIDFKAQARVETLRLLAISPWTLFGGQVWGQFALPVVMDLDVRIGPLHDHRSGIADPLVTGGLSWSQGRNSYVAGVDIVFPWGSYDASRLANPGNNHWSLQPTVAYHYHDPDAWEAGIAARYLVNGSNHATDYRSGNELIVDYAGGYNVGRARFGVVGYWLKQLTDDSGDGAGSGGYRGEAYAAGPSFTYAFGPGTEISLSWQHEFHSENRSQGDYLWLNFAVPFH